VANAGALKVAHRILCICGEPCEGVCRNPVLGGRLHVHPPGSGPVGGDRVRWSKLDGRCAFVAASTTILSIVSRFVFVAGAAHIAIVFDREETTARASYEKVGVFEKIACSRAAGLAVSVWRMVMEHV
jgi:hypothetical protein